MRGKVKTVSIILALAAASFMFRCANPSQPQGGPKDELGPTLTEKKPSDPPNQSTQITPKEVTFNFKEYLKPGNYRDEVFISPLQKKAPEVLVAGKTLKVKLRDDLLDSTTYVIVVGKGVKDFTEGNEMAQPIVFAFSTGAILDSLQIRGVVRDPVSGKGQDGYTVMLFEADSVLNNEIFGKSPKYLANTGETGVFKFYYLANGDYRIYAVKDEDRSYSYNLPKEHIALTENPAVELVDTGFGETIFLEAFAPDDIPPAPKSAKWINQRTVLVDFKEELNLKVGNDSLQIFVSDTNGENEKEAKFFQEIFKLEGRGQGKGQYLLYSPVARHNPVKISFRKLMDTLGNAIDTFVILDPASFDKSYIGKGFLQPDLVVEKAMFRINSTLPLQHKQDDSLIGHVLVDTSGNPLDATVTIVDYGIEIKLNEPPERPMKAKLILHQDFRWWDGSYSDSNYTFSVSIPGFESFGAISGFVNDTLFPGNWIVRLRDEKGSIIDRQNSEKFDFAFVPEGKYGLMLIRDEDGNGHWTPGSALPYRMPESVYIVPEPVEVKARWEIENLELVPRPKGELSPASNRKSIDD